MSKSKNILRGELTGLACEVVSSKNPSYEGIIGIIADETKNTIIIINQGRERKKVLKKGTIFRINKNGESALIDGDDINIRPHERIMLR